MVAGPVTITVNLSEEQLREAQALGLLTPEGATRSILKEIERQRNAQEIIATIEALQSYPDKPTPEEIEAEIEAYRAEKRAGRESSH